MNNFKEDLRHETKRTYSFQRLYEILLNCSQGICPTITKHDQYHLVDISLDGFVLDRAYYFYLDGLFNDERGRYHEAKNLIHNVFNCSEKPKFDATTIRSFEHDYRELSDKEKSVKNRKAYWISQRYGYDSFHDQSMDYCGACGFFENVKKIHERKFDQNFNVYNLNKFFDNNSHAASGMDLFRFCYARQLKQTTTI